MRRFAITAAVAAFVLVSVTAVVAVVGASSGGAEANDRLPSNDHAKGLVFDGLRVGALDGPCAGGYEVDAADAAMCTHGPDASEDGIDVREPRSVAELQLATLELPSVVGARVPGHTPIAAAADEQHVHADGSVHDHGLAAAAGDGSATATETGIVPVIGDGVSGNRVQAVYVVAADRPDRFVEIAPLIANWAAHVDAMVNASAAMTGGERHVRYVTDAAGALDIKKVVLPAEADDSFGNTINAMKAAGFNDPSRKYLMWTDATIYCGIATIYGDDKPTQDNYNNGRFAMYSRVDAGCWGKSNSVELHEIVHNFGAVQQSAPNVTPGWHCTDDYDRMCYRDSSTVTMEYLCPSSMEAYLDCGHDDYFHTDPPVGSYLDQHWNVADSSFLHVGPVDGSPPPPPPPPANTAPVVSATGPSSITLGNIASLSATVTDDGLPNGSMTVEWSKQSGPGTVSFGNAAVETTTATFTSAGVYVLTLTAHDGQLTGSASVTIDVQVPPTNAAPTVSVTAPPSIVVDTPAALDGTVADDDLPAASVTVEWQASGPGVATFADPGAEDTTVTFSAAGSYQLTLVANDGQLAGSASVAVTVDAPPTPDPVSVTETFSGSITRKRPSRTFDTVVADGPVSAVLSFGTSGGGGGGKGRKAAAAAADMTLNVFDASGTSVGTATGPSDLTLVLAPLPAGTYTWEVSGAQTSFTLIVTHLQ